jgi:hypothetical protein
MFAFKTYVVWDVSRTIYDGGVPTLDYAIFYPIFISFGVTTILSSLEIRPFPFFGVVLWLAILALSIFLFWLFDRLGAPVRAAQLDAIQKQNGGDEQNNGS